jgi:hypothetical protein
MDSRKLAHVLVDLSRFDLTEQSVLNYLLTEWRFVRGGELPAARGPAF